MAYIAPRSLEESGRVALSP